jgi:hypothetical protein
MAQALALLRAPVAGLVHYSCPMIFALTGIVMLMVKFAEIACGADPARRCMPARSTLATMWRAMRSLTGTTVQRMEVRAVERGCAAAAVRNNAPLRHLHG